MNRKPKIGDIGELSFVVTEQHAIDFADEKMPAVLSTPWLIWFLEHAARAAMLPMLGDDESTVGMQVDVEHLAATPLGQTVNCKATIINTDGRSISFKLQAHDEHELIASGLHKLHVINCERFRKRVLAKMNR